MNLKWAFLYWSICCFGLSWNCTSQTLPVVQSEPAEPLVLKNWSDHPGDSLVFDQKIKIVLSVTSLNARVMAIAKSFKATPYVSNTLEGNEKEQLVVNLSGLDCWTFVEQTTAMALTAVDSLPNYAQFVHHLQYLRYKDGEIDGYGSRLHYFCDWALNAETLGYIRSITRDLGGVKYDKKIRYMTNNPLSYPALADTLERNKVLAAEDRLNAHDWYYIPKANVKSVENKIQEGDIVVLTSALGSLDVEHQGFAVRGKDGVLRLLHASSKAGKVLYSDRSLSQYIARIPAMSGIMVWRFSD